MEIIAGIEIRDLALYVPKKSLLIIGDLHIGYEESLNKQGVLVPRFAFKDLLLRLEKVLDKKYDTIVVNGDIKHEFGQISSQEWRETLKILDLLLSHTRKVILVKGNHDTIIGPIANKRNVKIVNSYKAGDIFILHGDNLVDIPKEAKTIIIGHEHPGIMLQEPGRKEAYKCFLKGTYKRKNMIVMPSYNPVVYGSDVLTEKQFSPFMTNKDDFEVFVVEDKVYNFGKISRIKKFI
jgi:uncharacterized protein